MKQGRYVEAPEYYQQTEDDPPAIFLAGGISHLEDWRAELTPSLLVERCVVLNPRRQVFDLADPPATEEQVAWEQHHLTRVPRVVTLFWFPACDPAVTVQPIALFELGGQLVRRGMNRRVVVGAAVGYPRRLDLELQLRYAAPELPLLDSLADVGHHVRAMINPDYAFRTGTW